MAVSLLCELQTAFDVSYFPRKCLHSKCHSFFVLFKYVVKYPMIFPVLIYNKMSYKILFQAGVKYWLTQ